MALEELRARDSLCQGMLVLDTEYRARIVAQARCTEELAELFGARTVEFAGRIRARLTEFAELVGARCTELTEWMERHA